MTNYNERLDEILRELDRGEYLGKGGVPGAKQAITSLTKELVADAKPGMRETQRGRVIIYSDLSEIELNIIDKFEQNLLKALEEAK